MNTIPKFCEFHKFMLVEDLMLEKDYRRLHYGNCCVIGRVRETANGDYELENIRVNNLPQEYSLPEGTLAIRLLTFNVFQHELQPRRYCEVWGEVVLLHTTEAPKNWQPKTAADVANEYSRIENKDDADHLLETYRTTYKPAIKVTFANEIDQPSELAERKLRTRQITH